MIARIRRQLLSTASELGSYSLNRPRFAPPSPTRHTKGTAVTDEPALEKIFRNGIGAQYWFCAPSGPSLVACAGYADRRAHVAVTPSTTFHCFSTTKPITALAVLQLVDKGRLLLDAPVAAYLPELPYRNGATVRQVLSHQAGLPNPSPLSWVHAISDRSSFDPRAFFERVVREHPGCSPPGLRARYSNVGYLLLGRLIEIVSGRTYEQYVRDEVLNVIARDATSPEGFLGFEVPSRGHAVGYTRRCSLLGLLTPFFPDPAHLRSREGAWIRYRPFDLNGPAYGGLKGNVLGWAPLLTAIASRDARLLSREGFEAFFAAQFLTSGRPTGHALSWFTGRRGPHSYLGHAGGGPGYGAEIRIYPTLRTASALLTNTTIVSDPRHLDKLDGSWLP